MIRHRLCSAVPIVISLAIPIAAIADDTTYHVDHNEGEDGTNGHDGLTWAKAFKTVTYALTQATGDSDEIRVAVAKDNAGNIIGYSPGVNNGDSFTIDGGTHTELELKGGYQGCDGENDCDNGNNRDVDDPDLRTILTGSSGSNRVFNVVTIIGDSIGLNTLIEGFTIEFGDADGEEGPGDWETSGAGMRVGDEATEPSPTVRSCEFRQNDVDGAGGWGGGAGMAVIADDGTPHPTPEFIDCRFHSNESHNNPGGAIYSLYSSVVLIRCVVENNETTGVTSAGGILLFGDEDSAPKIISSTIHDNESSRNGGGVCLDGTSASQDTAFKPLLLNCVIDNNDADSVGGGIEMAATAAQIIHCTIASNSCGTADGGGGIAFAGDEDGGDGALLLNSIVWNNLANSNDHQIDIDADGDYIVVVEYTTVEDGKPGITGDTGTADLDYDNNENSDVDPQYDANFRIDEDSPARNDGGNEAAIPVDEFDIDNDGLTSTEKTPDRDLRERVVDDPDMGAFEFGCSDSDLDADINGDEIVDDLDMMYVIDGWTSSYPNCPPSYQNGDIDQDCDIDFDDLTLVLTAWCVGVGPDIASLPAFYNCWGADDQEWDDAMDTLETGSPGEQDDIICWIQHYDSCHCPDICVSGPTNCGDDPFNEH